MSAWVIWLIAAAVLVVMEILTEAVWALCFAAGCLAAMVMSFFVNSAPIQAICVAVVAIVTWILLAPVVRKWERKRSKTTRTGMDALLGRRGIVTHEIQPGECGRCRIDGDYWQVNVPGANRTIRRGEEVIITAYDSIILTGEPAKQ